MAIWYEGNLNKSENRHEENGAVYYVRGVRESEGRRYERYAVATHFIERGEDFVEVMRRYVSPLYQEREGRFHVSEQHRGDEGREGGLLGQISLPLRHP